MPQEFESENYRTKMVERFEEMLKTDSNHFLDAEIYLDIIEYYQETAQLENALKAAEMALELHPYSTELMLNKAQVLVNMYEVEHATNIIGYLKNVMPNDADVMLLEENIATQQGNHERSIEILEQVLAFSYQDKDEIGI